MQGDDPDDWRRREQPWTRPPTYGSPGYGSPGYGSVGYGSPYAYRPPPSPPPPLPRPRATSRPLRRLVLRLVFLVLVLDLAAETYFVGLNWFDPPATAYMLEAKYFGNGQDLLHDHVDLRYVSRRMIAATLAHEDADLPDRFSGLDWDELRRRAEAYNEGGDDPFGSPIPEQLSKNLLLFPAQNPVRKALDAVLAEQLVHAMPKTRVLELYLNVAQFGPGLYGVCDASWYYFNEPPDHMSWDDAYQLMGLLPGPEHARRGPRGGIDVSSGTADAVYTLKKVRGAQKYVPQELEISSGSDHLALVRDLGVPGEAAKQPDGPGSCRTMPDGVRDRIKAEARR